MISYFSICLQLQCPCHRLSHVLPSQLWVCSEDPLSIFKLCVVSSLVKLRISVYIQMLDLQMFSIKKIVLYHLGSFEA